MILLQQSPTFCYHTPIAPSRLLSSSKCIFGQGFVESKPLQQLYNDVLYCILNALKYWIPYTTICNLQYYHYWVCVNSSRVRSASMWCHKYHTRILQIHTHLSNSLTALQSGYSSPSETMTAVLQYWSGHFTVLSITICQSYCQHQFRPCCTLRFIRVKLQAVSMPFQSFVSRMAQKRPHSRLDRTSFLCAFSLTA